MKYKFYEIIKLDFQVVLFTIINEKIPSFCSLSWYLHNLYSVFTMRAKSAYSPTYINLLKIQLFRRNKEMHIAKVTRHPILTGTVDVLSFFKVKQDAKMSLFCSNDLLTSNAANNISHNVFLWICISLMKYLKITDNWQQHYLFYWYTNAKVWGEAWGSTACLVRLELWVLVIPDTPRLNNNIKPSKVYAGHSSGFTKQSVQ